MLFCLWEKGADREEKLRQTEGRGAARRTEVLVV